MTKGVKKFVKNEFKGLKLIFKYFTSKKIKIILSIETYKQTLNSKQQNVNFCCNKG